MQRTFREIMFLQELTMHDNIIKCALLTSTNSLPLTAASLLILACISWHFRSSHGAGHHSIACIYTELSATEACRKHLPTVFA